MRAVVCLALLLVTSCAPVRLKPLCPPLVHYSLQEQQQAARELRAHPDMQELPVMMRDYGNVRAECRALS
ncbi:hypothetical protein GS501_04455 [Saccharibacter sp. 17.LH.SD]|uniref:hypothetical protein n=1 Tax=Saccharibacter sp. 17.LH.SD TaxID=2689393 RepID=UPI0013712DD5|nr:hypothetical protein [Saccharibacter sp. 17.LH.SD]MXV44297.1 hypothetical protein [Saccharibacter sp. 17.LH.SD]